MSRAARLDSALEGHDSASEAIRQLVAAAVEVSGALAAERLTAAERARILERSIAVAGARRAGRRSGLRRLRPSRPLLVGSGAAIVVGAAALGWVALRVRRPIAA